MNLYAINFVKDRLEELCESYFRDRKKYGNGYDLLFIVERNIEDHLILLGIKKPIKEYLESRYKDFN